MTLPNGYHAVPVGKLAAVVTSLEMFERPAPRVGTPAPKWTLRQVASPPTQWYRELFRAVGEEYLWASRLEVPEAALRAILDEPLVEVYALRADERDAGLLELDFRVPGECELTFLGVCGALIGSGAGRWMMENALNRVWSRVVGRFWVHTCTLDHPGALAFYLRCGFRPFKREIEIFDDPRVTGLLPPAAAPQVPLLVAFES